MKEATSLGGSAGLEDSGRHYVPRFPLRDGGHCRSTLALCRLLLPSAAFSSFLTQLRCLGDLLPC